jgi:hypothetical protein
VRRLAAGVTAVLLLALAAIWAVPARAYACSCAQVSDEDHVSAADVIFTGRIDDDQSNQQTRTISFVVERIYKGVAGPRQVVLTSASGASCGLEIGGAGTFLVFANPAEEPGQLQANLCGGTRAGGAVAILGEGRLLPSESAIPSASPSPAAPRSGSTSGTLLIFLGIAIIAAAVAIAVRHARRTGEQR